MTETQMTANGTALLRVTLGVAALAHGLLKIFVFTLAGAAVPTRGGDAGGQEPSGCR